MRKINIFLFLIILGTESYSQNTIGVSEFEKGILAKNIQILDVRTAQEYNSGHLAGSLQANWNNQAEFLDRTQHLDKSKPVYIYCLAGGRSSAAMQLLVNKGYQVYNLEGGINAWKNQGKPVEGLSTENRISEQEYEGMTKSFKLVLIDFGAPWCPPCKKMEPVIDEIKQKLKNKVFVQFVDAGVNDKIANTHNVEALPTFIIYKNGKEVWRKQGLVKKEEFEKQIDLLK